VIKLIDECIKMKPKCKGSMEINQKTKHVNDDDFFVMRMTMMGVLVNLINKAITSMVKAIANSLTFQLFVTLIMMGCLSENGLFSMTRCNQWIHDN
jgi:hypothetical protein